jgi:hypothetical protein
MNWKLSIRSKLSKAILLLIALGVIGYLIQRVILLSSYVGDYYLGIKGTGCLLSINMDQTFSLTDVAKLPTKFLKGDEYHGTYAFDDGFVIFSLEDVSFNEVGCLMSPRYASIIWQGRTYLLPYDVGTGLERSQKERDQFCERIQTGEELDSERSGDILYFIDLNDLDQIDAPQGKDDLPRLFGIFSFCTE